MNMMNKTCGFAWLNDKQLLSLNVNSLLLPAILTIIQKAVNIYCYTSSTMTAIEMKLGYILEYCPLSRYTKMFVKM